MAKEHDEDLFESTRMTFGEHLEELRWAFFKAAAALVVGFLIGLWFAGDLVSYVQTPLRAALLNYYRDIAPEEYRSELERRRELGEELPTGLDALAEALAQHDLVAELRYIDPRETLEALARVYPDAIRPDALPETNADQPPSTKDLVPITLYHDLATDPRLRIIGLSVHEPFMVYVKAALVLGIVLSSPLVFYFIWRFVAVGLYPHEKWYVYVFLPISLGLFLAGVLMAFFFVFKFVLAFLFHFFAWMGIDPDPRITDWLSFVLILPLGFGIAFQLPLVMLFLERIGVFTVAGYMKQWRIAVLVIFVISMFLTPADPQSLILMAIPLTVLYFGGVLLCKIMPGRAGP